MQAQLWSRLQAAKAELVDLEEEQHAERFECVMRTCTLPSRSTARDHLLEEKRLQAREIKLYRLLVENFIPASEVEKVCNKHSPVRGATSDLLFADQATRPL